MKLVSVQYLRGLAAILVVLTHAIAHPLQNSDPTVQHLGGTGVTLFFVISGFIMVYVTGTGSFDPLDFFKRRVMRVVPLYWLATIAVAILAAAAPSLLKNTRFDWAHLVQSLLFIPHYRPNGEMAPMLKLGWTLNLEMFFYLLFAFFAGVSLRVRVAGLSVVLIGLVIAGQLHAFTNPFLHLYTYIDLFSFSVGIWVGLLAVEKRIPSFGLPPYVLGLAGLFVIVTGHLVVSDLFYPIQAIGSAIVLMAGLQGENRMPESRIGLLLGDASYSVYLVHLYMIALVIAVWRRLPVEISSLVVVPIALVAGTVFGVLVHLYVEKPVQRFLARRKRAQPKRVDITTAA